MRLKQILLNDEPSLHHLGLWILRYARPSRKTRLWLLASFDVTLEVAISVWTLILFIEFLIQLQLMRDFKVKLMRDPH